MFGYERSSSFFVFLIYSMTEIRCSHCKRPFPLEEYLTRSGHVRPHRHECMRVIGNKSYHKDKARSTAYRRKWYARHKAANSPSYQRTLARKRAYNNRIVTASGHQWRATGSNPRPNHLKVRSYGSMFGLGSVYYGPKKL